MSDKEKEMRRLTALFMDGETSREQEQRLAEYFRTGDVPEDMADYKAMFDYFDEGMPLSGDAPDRTRRHRVWPLLTAIAAVAASVAVVLVLHLHGPSQPSQPLAQHAGQTPPAAITVADTAAVAEKDSAVMVKPEEKTGRRMRQYRRHRYRIAPPKTFMAQTMPTDTISAETDRAVTEMLMAVAAGQDSVFRQLQLLGEIQNTIIADIANEGLYECEEEQEIY